MRQVVTSTVAYAILGAIVAGVVVLIGVDRRDLVLDSYLVYAGGLVALAASRVAHRAFPRPRGTVPAVLSRPPRRYVHPESLLTAEDDVAQAQAVEFAVHFRQRPQLHEIAAAGLAMQAGIELDREPERAEQRLSPETWELVRPGRPRPEREGTSGISTSSLTAVVDELERILPS